MEFELKDGSNASTKAEEITPGTASARQSQAWRKSTLSNDRDRAVLARLGKKQVLKRNFGLISMLAFSCTVLVTWEGVFGTFEPGFENGGPAGLVYGYIAIWAGTLATFVSISEIASIAPTAGGQYHWVYILSPPSCRKFLSYLTGWMTLVAWQAAIASNCFLTASIVQGTVILNYPNYTPQPWQLTLMAWAAVGVCVLVNTVVGGILPLIESCILVIHVFGFIAILIVMTYMAPQGTAADVFQTFINEGAWPTQGLSTMVGLIGLVYAFVGADAAVHMSEEISNPALNVPRSIVSSMVINGALGFGILLATLFGIGNVDNALNTDTGIAFIEIFTQATRSNAGGTALTSIIIFMILAAAIGATATSSRMIWAFARDRGTPFSGFLSKVHPHSSLPLNSVAVTTIVACLLLLINLGSSTVLNDVLSLSIAGYYSTYFAACALLLWRRCTGAIREPDGTDGDDAMVTDASNLRWGVWRMPQPVGIAVNAFACCYLVVIVVFSFFPPELPVTPANMNYSALMTGAVVIFSLVYYFLWGRRNYNGPIIETDVGHLHEDDDETR